tara:strand:- start:15948 stop:16919 length:972 start_codon:yes stop_codon:yes gene_type:complete
MINKNIARQFARIGPRGIYGQSLLDIAQHNENIFAISADLGNSSGLDRYKSKLSSRFLNIGIAEQNMIGFAAGLSSLGFNVFVSSFAPFICLRSGEQVRMNLSYMKSNVKIVAIGSGISMGYLGNSHFGLEDISIIRSLPNIKIICPCDCIEVSKAVKALSDFKGPAFLRLTGAAPSPIINTDDYEFEIGKLIKLESGNDCLIIANGTIVSNALKSAKILKEKFNISSTVVNMHTLRPVDEEIIDLILKHKNVVTIEEHSVVGGLGTIISEMITFYNIKNVRLKKLGLPPSFLKSGTYLELLERYSLDSEKISEVIYIFLNKN